MWHDLVMRPAVDTRLWNLVALGGLSLGCGPGTAGPSTTTASTTNSASASEDDSGIDPTTGEQPCVVDDDCPPDHFCDEGSCEYYSGGVDGTPFYECVSDYDCGTFEICLDGDCFGIGEPPPDCEAVVVSQVPLPSSEVLDLSFVDLDGDLDDELVLVREAEFEVWDQLEGAPKTAAGVHGTGWMGVLSSLKTLLETGEPL